MRLIATILMILVLFLAGQPVCAAANAGAQTDPCCESTDPGCGESPAGDDHDNDCSGCNPFQSCSCCVAGIEAPLRTVFITAEDPAFSERPALPGTAQSLLTMFPEGIWQPPRQA